MGFFSRRRERESAIPASEDDSELGSFANPEGQEVVGRQIDDPVVGSVEGLSGADGLAMLAQLGPMIQKAIAEGNVQVSVGEPQTIDARGTEHGARIREIMAEHGIDPEQGVTDQTIDVADYEVMQRRILEALFDAGRDGEGRAGTK